LDRSLIPERVQVNELKTFPQGEPLPMRFGTDPVPLGSTPFQCRLCLIATLTKMNIFIHLINIS
jgi:hypothetical protein